jgi:methionine sulfoxide reductase heme-binding subunit
MPFLRDNNGRWSHEKIAALAMALVPASWLLCRVWMGDLDPARPITDVIHYTGRWAVRLLLLSLAITPARFLFSLPKLVNARRTLGVAACCYAVFHFLLYVADQKFRLGTVAAEIALRFYLTIGFVALIGLIALGVTSTEAAIRRLGRKWNMLHRAAYAIGLLAIIHFMLQKKLDIYEPVLMAGFLLWLLGYRLWRRYGSRVALAQLAAITAACTVLTALLEAFWYRAMTGVPAMRVLEANLMFAIVIRPMWWVAAAGAAVIAGYLAAKWLWPKPVPRLRAAE